MSSRNRPALLGAALTGRIAAALDRLCRGIRRPAAAPATSPATLHLSAANRIGELDRLATVIGEFAEANSLPQRQAMHLDLAIEEIVSNVIKYGFEPGDERDDAVDITLVLDGRRLAIRIRDRGRPFDPLADAPEPDTDAGVADRRIGGLGVHFVKRLMADLRYRREGDSNVLEMVLDLNGPS